METNAARRIRTNPIVVLALLGAAALFVTNAAQAGPWDVGDTKPSKQYKIKFKSEWKHTSSKDSIYAPTIKFGGPISPRLSYELATGYGSVKKQGQSSQSGMDDFSAKLKVGLMSEKGSRPDVMLEPKLSFDTGDVASGVGAGVTTLQLPLRAGKSFGNYYLTGEVRYTHGFDSGYTNKVGYGALLEYKPSPTWVVGMDLFNERPVHDGGSYHLRSNVAVKYKPGKHWEWHGLVGRSVHNAAEQPQTKVKFEIVYKF